MPVNLTVPLRWTNAVGDDLRLLQTLQGNILKGHGREFVATVFVRFDPTKVLQSKRFLRDLANFHLVSANAQLLASQAHQERGTDGGPFMHVALSFKGYRALGLQAAAPADPDFQGGMSAAASVAALSDPAVTT